MFWERILAVSGAHGTILSHIMLLNVLNWLPLRRRSCYLNLYEAHGLNTSGQLPHLMNNGRKSVLCGELRAPHCPGFIDSFFMLYLTYVSYIVIAGLWKNIMCPATIRSENMLSKHKETCYKPSHRTTNKHGETRYCLNCCHEERCNRKRIHTHFLKDRICEMQEWQNYFGLYARDAQVKQYLQQQNLGELITAEDKVLIETCESWNNHRYAIVGQIWQRKDPWWNKTSQGRHGIISWNLALICEVDHGIIEKSKSTLHRSKKIWDCWMAVRWIEEGTFA